MGCLIPCLRLVLLLSNAFVVKGYCTAYSSGTYTDSITAQGAGNAVTLSGNIIMNYASDDRGSAAFLADNNGSISGTLNTLTINLLNPALAGIRTRDGGEVTLTVTEPLSITGQGDQVEAISSLIGRGIHITGPVQINTTGNFSQAVSSQPGAITIDGPLSVNAEGSYAQGLFVRHITTPGTVTLNGATNIQVSGQDASGISGWNSIVYIHNALTISASDNAYAIQTMGSSQYMFPPSPSAQVADDPDIAMALTTRSSISATQPNPQVININGKISIQGEYNQLILDLDSGSHINSQLVEASNKGTFRLHFHKPDAKWTTDIGSSISGGGSLVLEFVNGGIWAMPLAEENRRDNHSPVAPLTIARDGTFTIQGRATLLGNVQTLMEEGEQTSYLLVKKDITDSPLSLDLSQITAITDQENYSLSLQQQNVGNEAYLYGLLAHNAPLPLAESIPYNAVLTRTLPVAMIDQDLASRLVIDTSTITSCNESLGATGVDEATGRCHAVRNPDVYPWILPFYEHSKAKDLSLDARHIGYKANIRGLAIGVAQAFAGGRWGMGVFTGDGDIDSRGDISPSGSHADYRGGMLFGRVRLGTLIATTACVYLHSDHHLHQYSDVSRLTSNSEMDTWSGQAGLSMPVLLNRWTIMPGAGLSYWHTRQRRGQVTDQQSGQVYGHGRSTQTYWQFPLSISARGQNLPLMRQTDVAVIPEVSARFIPSLGNRNLSVTVWSNEQPEFKIRQPGVRRDRNSIEMDAGIQLVSHRINSRVRYGVRKSRHTFSQQISGELSWAL